jgi:signal transduction histidine kinase/ActR/RegA family two-component response regulator
MAALSDRDDPSSQRALVNGRESLQAAPWAEIEPRLIAAFQAEPSSMLQGLFAGDEAIQLQWIIEQLQHLTAIPFAFVGEVYGEDWERVRTIELRTPMGRGDNVEYDLLGTPCASVVVNKTTCIYRGHVAEMFPTDELLARLGIQTYIGLPLLDPSERPLGLLVLMDQQARTNEDLRETMRLMLAFRPPLEKLLIHRRARRDVLLLSERLEDNSEPLARLTRTFAHAMHVRGAFVARVSSEDHRRMRTVATAIDGAMDEQSVEFELADAHMRELEATGELLIRTNLDEAWPQARAIASFPACACLCLRLDGPDGRVIGQLGLLHDRPLNRHIGDQHVVRAFRQQIAFELYRNLDEAERQANDRRLLELQRTEGLGILAGGIAHDFNNLLVGVFGNADLALADLPEDGDGELRECLVDIRDAAHAAMQLCRQMLAYAGHTTVESQRFDLAAEVEDLARLLSASIPSTIELIVERSESCWLDGDLVQIRQVLMNLITNAADAIVDRNDDRPGHITISLGSPCSHQHDHPIAGVTGTLAPGNYVRLSVCDDGCGIDEATRARIFDPFFTTKPHGHGLGLASMLGIVRAHGGTLTVDSKPGVGSCFNVYFPLTDDASTESSATPEPLPLATRSFRVLVVDDERRVRKVARRILERAKYQVVTAIDGLEALEIFERERDSIDCVVLDIGMPRLGGIETMQRLRALVPDLPVILSSGYSKGNALDAVADDPCCVVVHKPYDVEALTGAVAKLLQHKSCNGHNKSVDHP